MYLHAFKHLKSFYVYWVYVNFPQFWCDICDQRWKKKYSRWLWWAYRHVPVVVITLHVVVLDLTYTLTVDSEVQPPLLFVDASLERNILTGTVTLSSSKTEDTITQTIYIEVCMNSVHILQRLSFHCHSHKKMWYPEML